MLVDLFYLLRPVIDFAGVITLLLICLGATLYLLVWTIKTYWKVFVGIGVGCSVFFVLYICTNGFAF